MLADAQLTFAALGALPSRDARAGVAALVELDDRHGLRRVDEQLSEWMRACGIGE